MHLSNQDYTICFRRESGYCSICYSNSVDGVPNSGNGMSPTHLLGYASERLAQG